MKKINCLWMCVALVAALFTSCQNEDEFDELVPVEGIVLTASTEPDTRISFEDNIDVKLKWAEGDIFTVYNGDGDRVGNFKLVSGQGGNKVAQFVLDGASSANLTATGNTAVYPKNAAQRLPVVPKNISTSFIYAANDLSYLDKNCRMRTTFNYNAGTNTASKITFQHQLALLTLTVSKPTGFTQTITKFELSAQQVASGGGNTDVKSTLTFTNTDFTHIFDTNIKLYMFISPSALGTKFDFKLILGNTDQHRFKQQITTSKAYVGGYRYSGALNSWSHDIEIN